MRSEKPVALSSSVSGPIRGCGSRAQHVKFSVLEALESAAALAAERTAHNVGSRRAKGEH